MGWLLVKQGEQTVARRRLADKPVTIGRLPDCDIVLDTPYVSGHHAMVIEHEGVAGLSDLNSSNGTFLRNRRLERPVRLKSGDRIRIGPFFVEYHEKDPEAGAASTDSFPPVSPVGDGAAPWASDSRIARILKDESRRYKKNPFPDPGPQVTPVDSTWLEPTTPPDPSLGEDPISVDEIRAESQKAKVSGDTEPLLVPTDEAGEELPTAPVEPSEKQSPLPPTDEADEAPAIIPVERSEKQAPLPSTDEADEAPTTAPVEPSEKQSPLPTLDEVDEAPSIIPVERSEKQAPLPPEVGEGAGEGGLAEEKTIPADEIRDEDGEEESEEQGEESEEGKIKKETEPEEKREKEGVEGGDDDDAIGDEGGDEEIEDKEEGEDEDDGGTPPPPPAAKPAGDNDAPAAIGEFEPVEGADEAENSRPEAFVAVDPPIDDALRRAINDRLAVHEKLAALARERDFLRQSLGAGIPPAIAAEFDRQDRELKTFPAADIARNRLQQAAEREQREAAKYAELRAAGQTPPEPHEAQLLARGLAAQQWDCFVRHDALAAELVRAARAAIAAGDEPLPRELAAGGIDADAGALLALSIHRLALEVLAREVVARRKDLQATAAQEDKKPKKRGFRLFGGKKDKSGGDDGDDASDPVAEDARLAERSGHITREMALADTWLLNEYWRIFAVVALWAAGGRPHPEMSATLRAFLRWGLVGHAPWFLAPDLLDFVMADCRDNVRREWPADMAATHLLYADEYLAFVADNRITPGPDEKLELGGRNSPEWKADRGLRRLVTARDRVLALEQTRDRLRVQAAGFQEKLDLITPQLAALPPGGTREAKKHRRELQEKVQALKIEIGKRERAAARMNDETLPALREQIADGEAAMNDYGFTVTRDYLVAREVGQLRRLGNLCANLKERYLPWCLREFLKPMTDQCNDRAATLGRWNDLERRDPGMLLETIIPARKKPERTDLRWSPVVMLLPAAGTQAYSWSPRTGVERGKLAAPLLFIRPRLAERAFASVLSDFRFDTVKAGAGMDLMTSDTFIAAFMKVRWDYRKKSREAREKAGIYADQNDRLNFRRIYSFWLASSMEQGRKLYFMNYDLYDKVICPYFDFPDGVVRLKK